MPTLDEDFETPPIKYLMLGDSGGGKTAALASLAKVGYKLKIHDFDNGLDILRDESVLPKEFRHNVDYMTLTDKFTGGAMGAIPSAPEAFKKAMSSLNTWDGGIQKWGPEVVYVCDSLTMMGDSALRYVLFMNQRLQPNVSPWQSDWGEAMKKQEEYLQMLYSSRIRCNVAINCHVKMLGDFEKDDKGHKEEVNLKGYPLALGRQLPPKVGRYFNNVFYIRSVGSGASTKRTIFTDSRPEVELKNSRPSKIKARYPVETGLADIFEAINGHRGPKIVAETEKQEAK